MEKAFLACHSKEEKYFDLEIVKGKKTALLLGATGLVGRACLDLLLAHPAYERVVAFGRREVERSHSRLEQHLIDFDRLEDYRHLIRGNDLFCCLGTTRQKAGSKEAFFKVDFTYTYETAKIAAENGVSQLLLVSSVGADPESPFFYSRVKGQLEEAVQQLPFWAVHIFRPSILLGQREELRVGEKIAGWIMQGIDYVAGERLSEYQPVEAETVAGAMIHAAQQLETGRFFYPSHRLKELAADGFSRQIKNI